MDSIAQGRIWTGEQAAERGLVDMTGGLNLAVQLAALAGGVEEGESFGVKVYPRRMDLDIGEELLWVTMRRLPENVRLFFRNIDMESQWRAGEPMLLMPYTVEID